MSIFRGDDREIDFEEEDTLASLEERDYDYYNPFEEEMRRKLDAELDSES